MTSIPFIFISLLALGVLIFVHELGHFLLAKWNGVGVSEFAIGFGKILYRVQVGETKYSLRAIPLGGFVQMYGDDPRLVEKIRSNTVETSTPEEELELQSLLEKQDRWFLSKGYLAKASIVLAGPLFNIFFAVFLSIATYALLGKPVPVTSPTIGGVMPGDPAAIAGIEPGDTILSINGLEVNTWEKMAEVIAHSKGEPLALLIERDTADGVSSKVPLTLQATNERNENYEQFDDDSIQNTYRIGVIPQAARVPIGIGEAVLLGVNHVWYLSRMTISMLGKMVFGKVSAKNISGPLSIISHGAKEAKSGFDRLVSFSIFLSVSLAILNLLPVPILDGGHLLFFTLEKLRGAPLSLRVQEAANQVGLVFLLLLMAFALGNDIFRHILPL
ncbi:MAG: RIP metalloprotease RseP [Bdellovibrionales bacterium]|nr:RIP metalloprotease RseP [Bdellovibrionales bacterium]